jgi:hypothetical protein
LAQSIYLKFKLKIEPDLCFSRRLTGIFAMVTNLVVLFVNEQDISSKEEALIDRDSNIFDTKITVSPVSVSRSNLLDNVGMRLPFLEAAQASHPLRRRSSLSFS